MEFSIIFDPFHVRIGINIHHTAFFTLVIISFILETFTLIQGWYCLEKLYTNHLKGLKGINFLPGYYVKDALVVKNITKPSCET